MDICYSTPLLLLLLLLFLLILILLILLLLWIHKAIFHLSVESCLHKYLLCGGPKLYPVPHIPPDKTGPTVSIIGRPTRTPLTRLYSRTQVHHRNIFLITSLLKRTSIKAENISRSISGTFRIFAQAGL